MGRIGMRPWKWENVSPYLGVSSPHFTTLCVGCKLETRQTSRLFPGERKKESILQEDNRLKQVMIKLSVEAALPPTRIICEECGRISMTPKLGFGLGIS